MTQIQQIINTEFTEKAMEYILSSANEEAPIELTRQREKVGKHQYSLHK